MAAAVLAVAAACPLLPMSFLHVPSIHLRSVKPAGQPASTSVFGPEDNVAKAGNGPQKISAQRSVVFLLDAPPSMPVDQKREVPTSCPSFTAHSSGPCSYFCPRSPSRPRSHLSLSPPPRRSRPRTRSGRCCRMLCPCRRALWPRNCRDGACGHLLPRGHAPAPREGDGAARRRDGVLLHDLLRGHSLVPQRLPQGPRGSHGPGLIRRVSRFPGTCSHAAYLLAARSVPLSSAPRGAGRSSMRTRFGFR